MLRNISIRWIFASFVLIAGGIGMSAAILAQYTDVDPWAGHTGFFLGGLVGGFTVARASRGITIVEPALGGFLITGMFFGFFGLSPESAFVADHGVGEREYSALSLSLVSLFGGLTGAVAGERLTARHAPSERPWRRWIWQCWVGLLSYGGCLLALWVVLLVVTQMSRHDMVNDGGFFILTFIVGTFLSGFITQAMNSDRNYVASGSGPFWCLLLLSVFALVKGGFREPGVVLLITLSGVVVSAISVVGALVGHHTSARWYEDDDDKPELPEAKLAAKS